MRNPSPPANPFFNAQLAQLDTLRYRVYAHTTLAEAALRLTATVTALVPAGAETDDDAVCARVQTALRHFIATDWAVTLLDRESDAPGYAQLTLHASARLAPAEHFNLQERARLASREGIVLSDLNVAVAVPAKRLTTLVATLREETLAEIARHIAGMNHLSGRRWHIGDLRFGADTDAYERLRRAGRAAPAARDNPPDAGQTERVLLVTEVVLKAESPTLH